MSRQKKKYNLAMCGEYYVAAELHRRGIPASITYGNAKKADVVATSEDGEKAVSIEVKTTSQPKWVVGQYVPEPSDKIWIFVHVPSDSTYFPSFYVLTQAEIHAILKPLDEEYRRRFKQKNGVEYGDKPGVCSLKRSQLADLDADWDKITSRLNN
jgi:hypothetical protein